MEKHCSLCKRIVDSETADILAVGAFGDPKYVCEDCVNDIEAATTSRDYEQIKAAMSRISDKMAKNDIINETTLSAVETIFTEAKDRAERIKEGTYDFSEDEITADEPTGIPDELLESPEDIALDEKEKKENKVLNLIIDVVAAAVLITSITLFVIWIL